MRDVTVLIVGDFKSSYVNVEFDSVENLIKSIDDIIYELGIGSVSIEIEDDTKFSPIEISFLNTNDIII